MPTELDFSYDPTTDAGKVRLLLNDVDEDTVVFADAEIDAFLALHDGAIFLAAAQAIDTNADNEVLASKVLRTQDLSTDGAKVADALRKRAAALREQHAQIEDGDGFFEIIPSGRTWGPELAPSPTLDWF